MASEKVFQKQQLMRNLRPRTKILFIVLLTCSAAISLTYESILCQIGRFLVLEQQPQKADVIVVLNGRDIERSLAAVDLYKQGYANLIVLSRGTKSSGYELLLNTVDQSFDRRIFFQRAIEAMGVPSESFQLIGNGVTSTYDEATVTRDFLRQRNYTSLILVTSKWHSKRAYLTFRHILNKNANIQLKVYASGYDKFDPNFWWKTESSTELVLSEYVRLLYYLIMSRLSLLS